MVVSLYAISEIYVTPSKQAKSMGFKSLVVIINMTGKSRTTLTNWCYNEPELFKIVLAGCKVYIEMENKDEC